MQVVDVTCVLPALPVSSMLLYRGRWTPWHEWAVLGLLLVCLPLLSSSFAFLVGEVIRAVVPGLFTGLICQ